MESLAQTVALLGRTPPSLEALLRGLPEFWTAHSEGDSSSWTVRDVVAHLIYADRHDWLPRARIILQPGGGAFEPFDRLGHVRESAGRTLPQLLDQFALVRREMLAALDGLNLEPADLERCGHHPALGSVTLGQLLATWAVHDLTHLHQISRIMAHQFREQTGPFSEYLGVLRCAGHSAG